MAEPHDIICEAIRRCVLLEFEYKGYWRVVQPYCYGVSHRDADVLRAIQVRGASSSKQLESGKLWTVDEIRELRILDETFEPDDPNYNPNDSAMKRIHCRIERD